MSYLTRMKYTEYWEGYLDGAIASALFITIVATLAWWFTS